MGKTLSRTPHLREVMTPAQLDRSPDHLRPVPLVPDDTALLQYTSGSTGAQKGVELSHRNILSNVHAMGLGMRCRPYVDVSCSWLPLCHDMGLIGGLFTSMYWQMILVMLSPQAFIGDPKRWLWTFHHHQVTLSTAPNFAYELCARRIPEEELAGLDLSSWRLALNGAEPVAMASLDAFATRFEKHGFRRDAFFPVYGLAESTLAVTFPVPNAPLITDVVERDGLETRGVAVPAEAESATLHVVSVGRPIDGAHVRVVDAEGRVLPDRQVGELETRGPSVMKGYFRAPEASARTLRDGWLRTGDLAYLVDGNLFIAGREKDLIITRGRNYYPHDLEAAVERLPGVRTGCTAAFGVPDETTGTESVVLLVETKVEREATPSQAAALIETIQKALSTAIGLRADQVVLLPPRTLPRTTSGKLQRREARRRFLAGTLLTTKPPRWSLARTVARSLLELARHRWRRRFGNAGAP
jgi:acyl-CoA synthetase (AMP-forming)/AMP-acid ligase II